MASLRLQRTTKRQGRGGIIRRSGMALARSSITLTEHGSDDAHGSQSVMHAHVSQSTGVDMTGAALRESQHPACSSSCFLFNSAAPRWTVAEL
eukprot:10916408-Alexandrium_andersonii.AAC.1